MKKIPDLLTALMIITLLVITGFQVYWLKDNYEREKRALEIRSNVMFQEAVRQLQASKLKLAGINNTDTATKKIKMIVAENGLPQKDVHVKMMQGQEVVTMVNTLRKKLHDTSVTQTKTNVFINIDKNASVNSLDTFTSKLDERLLPGGDRIFRFLYGVDSLQDSLKVPEITKAYNQKLTEEKLSIPFTIARLKDGNVNESPDLSEVTVGFAKPITYKLLLGNTTNYLLKRISMPLLFSLFLVGATLLSFILVFRTIVKQKRLADIKNEFISNITHELKTPIATVAVAIEALKNFNAMDDAEKTKEYLNISSNELQRLSLLVDKVLKLSMLEKKEIELKYEETDIRNVVDEVVNSMRLQFEKNNAEVNVVSSGNTVVQADRLHMLSVIYNLVDNAVKYSPQNPAIKIMIEELDKNILLVITDDGQGIPAAYKDKIFEKFFRVPAGNTHNAPGYGLGLSYVLHIIQKHHGSIEVESEEGKGSTFIIKLPKTNGG
ncbi:MAG: HAMP domain-containing sensor histidine kinase [Bacteroidota bacterium]